MVESSNLNRGSAAKSLALSGHTGNMGNLEGNEWENIPAARAFDGSANGNN
ncbi:hypothetical protein HU200_010628 [Digitaria exilis]|uniref:Uncharacterized protein n=1 Tax=Digitaria exilis TaxID=1010633 RepID=A0A835FI05_9POAL|nr:hypothetical protein HU200_010628 [Digitaria exilis]